MTILEGAVIKVKHFWQRLYKNIDIAKHLNPQVSRSDSRIDMFRVREMDRRHLTNIDAQIYAYENTILALINYANFNNPTNK